MPALRNSIKNYWRMEEVNEVLQACSVEDCIVRLPDVQLERDLYLQVQKKLEGIGGKWNRKHKGFLFEQDPTEFLTDVRNGNNRNLKNEFQFFATPGEVADRMVEQLPFIEAGFRVLEPSA